jgi:hypothetical protein
MKNVFDRIDKIRLMGLILFILICMLITCSGCVGGKKINANSTGVNIAPSRLVPQPNGVFKLEPVQIRHPKIKPVKIEPVKSRPIQPEFTSAEPSLTELTPVKPVLIEPKMNVIPIKDPPKVTISTNNTSQTNDAPIIIDNNWCGTEDPAIAGPCKKEPKMDINWMELIKFYLLGFGFMALMYFGWKTARKKTQDMIKEERSKKKAPKKAPRKRAAKKSSKKSTRKRK